jgi:hypothetical protein
MNSNDPCKKTEQHVYTPVKPNAFDAWKIWNNLTTAAQLLWEEYEDDFIVFCCDNISEKRKKEVMADYDPF